MDRQKLDEYIENFPPCEYTYAICAMIYNALRLNAWKKESARKMINMPRTTFGYYVNKLVEAGFDIPNSKKIKKPDLSLGVGIDRKWVSYEHRQYPHVNR